jgi:hypothetical protein
MATYIGEYGERIERAKQCPHPENQQVGSQGQYECRACGAERMVQANGWFSEWVAPRRAA